MKKTTCALVTDREKAIVNAIKDEIPNVHLVFCWIHTFWDIHTWCHKHGAPASGIAVCVSDVQQLFHLPTANEYQERLTEMTKDWDAIFTEYFMQEIDHNVGLSIGRWELEEKHIYNPYSCVPDN